MSKRGLLKLSLNGAVLFCVFVAVYLFVWKRKRGVKHVFSDKVEKHTASTSSEDALKYWTADKMSKAKAMDLPQVTDLKPGEEHHERS